jgi:enoyl-CoA hydratase/carnithine racemase
MATDSWWQNTEEVVPKVIERTIERGGRRARPTAATWEYDSPKYTIEGELAIVKLDDVRNANGLTQKTTAALTDIAIELHGRPDVKVVLFTAAGAYFCTGGAFAANDPTDKWYTPEIPQGLSLKDTGTEGSMPTAMLFYLMCTLPQYKVASIRGENMGAGNSLICSMDYVIAPDTKKTKCNFKEATRGLASCISWQGIVSKLGAGRARAVTLCSDTKDAFGCKALGVVDEVVQAPSAEVAMRTSDETARAKAEEVAKLPMEEIKKLKTTGSGTKGKLFKAPEGAKDCQSVQGPVPDYWKAVEEVIEACGATGRPAAARLSKQMWPHSSVELKLKGQHVAVIRLNSPETDNAIDKGIVAGLIDACIELHRSIGRVRLVVLQADGPNFCAGLDKSLAADDKQLHRMLFLLYMLPMYVMVEVQGKASGLGAVLALACDRIIMMSSATYDFKGLTPSLGGEYISNWVGPAKLKELAAGAPLTAEAAKEMHLAYSVASSAKDVEEEMATVCELTTYTAPNAVAEEKGFVQQLAGANVNFDTLWSISAHVAYRNMDPEFDDAIGAVIDPDHKPHYRKDDTFTVTTQNLTKALTGPPVTKALPAPARATPASTSVMI